MMEDFSVMTKLSKLKIELCSKLPSLGRAQTHLGKYLEQRVNYGDAGKRHPLKILYLNSG